ncbi:MAG: porin [Burkholderiales bacterium]|nr:porin [Burkholderiales bacterium]
MKKSLIALAVLASTGAAMAQSSVTLYGIVDVNLQSQKDEINAGTSNAVRQTSLSSGGVSTSRWGLKGSEDLGGGLKANFVLENGFDASTGAAAGAQFNRQSWVGVSGGFGELRLGNDYTARDDINGAAHAVFDSAFSPSVFIESGYNSNPNNQIKYLTPSFSGFSGAVSYALGENKAKSASGNAEGVAAVNVQYAAGPVYVGIAYQEDKGPVAASATGKANKDTFLNATYDLGVAKILASYRDVKNTLANGSGANSVSFDKQRVYQIGADVPVGAALVVSAGYAHSKSELAGINDVTGNGFAIGASYSLSKRTSIYTALNYSKAKQDGSDDLKSSVYAVGVRHAF